MVVGEVITSQDDRSEAIQMARVYKRVLVCFTVSFITVFPMMMIAFITFKSSLVPLLEGL